MEVVENMCKLCLKYSQGDGYSTIDEKILNKLEFLQINLDQSFEECNSLCKECNEKIDNAFEFKSSLINSKNASESEDMPNTSTDETSAENCVCYVCKTLVDTFTMISFKKLLEDHTMMDVFQRHIQEMDIEKFAGDSLVCAVCQKSLASFLTLISTWVLADDCNDMDMKQDMKNLKMVVDKKAMVTEGEMSDSNNTNSTSALGKDNSDSVSTSIAPKGKRKGTSQSGSSTRKKIKTEGIEISKNSDSVAIMNGNDVKRVDSGGVDDMQLLKEEVNIKDEDGLSVDNAQWESDVNVHQSDSTNSNDVGICICKECSYHVERQSVGHKSLLKSYRCKDCTFVTNCKETEQTCS